MTDIAVALVVLAAIVPLTMWGVRVARRHRRTAFAPSQPDGDRGVKPGDARPSAMR